MQVPEDQCPDPRVRHANFIYFSGLLDRGLFRWSMDSGSVPFLYSAAGAISRVTAWGPSAPPVTDRAVSGTRVKICQI